MELNTQNDVIIIPKATTDPPYHHDEPKAPQKRKKDPVQAIRVALLKMGSRSRKSKAHDESKSIWRKLVGSMRPLHLQGNQSPRKSPKIISHQNKSPSEYNTDEGSEFPEEEEEEEEEEPYSPSPPTPSTLYASAVGLNEMVQGDEEIQEEIHVEKCNENENGNGGDEMIDAKADEFIAQFYKEMRLQRLDTVDIQYKKRSHRSLGY